MPENLLLEKTSCAEGQHNMTRPLQVDLWPFDFESGVRVKYDVGYFCLPISVFLGLSVLDLGPMYATDVRQMSDVRQTSDAHHRLISPLWGRGHNKKRR